MQGGEGQREERKTGHGNLCKSGVECLPWVYSSVLQKMETGRGKERRGEERERKCPNSGSSKCDVIILIIENTSRCKVPAVIY